MTSLTDGLHRKAQEALRENLAPGEEVRVVVHGSSNTAAMIATDRRVFVFKTGVSAGATFGAKFTSFDYRNIGGVELHTGALTGSVVLDIAGAAPVGSSFWGNSNNDPWKAQNAIPITRPFDRPKEEIAHLRELIASRHGQDQQPAPASSARASIADELGKLANLHSQGVLTDEEFAAQKARLLAP